MMIRWNIREQGFDMVLSGGVLSGGVLSGGVPGAIRSGLSQARATFLEKEAPIDLWAVHPRGRTVLDAVVAHAVEASLEFPPRALAVSRGVLSDFGNMPSATVTFELGRMTGDSVPGSSDCAMAFGPGLVAETMLFRMAA
jgi:predicted naringenin-chalcone synthase